MIKDLPSNILDEEVSILLTLKATLKETKTSGEVGVVITLPKKITPTSFYFDGTVYNAEYKNDDKPSIKVDLDITIKEDADYSAQVSLTGGLSDSNTHSLVILHDFQKIPITFLQVTAKEKCQ